MGARDLRRYVAWNSRIALFWLTRPNESGRVYLTVTPSSLAAAAWECDGTLLTPDEAEQDFLECVGEMYRVHVMTERRSIESLGEVHDGVPLSIAFLAASVFAAYRMRDDQHRRSTAYFPRLAEILGFSVLNDEPPLFDKDGFENLWKRASRWTQDRLVLVTGALRRFEAYPIAHAALRKVDLDRLPDFFDWASYAPGASVALERVRGDFLRWLGARSLLTPRGEEASRGDHQEAAIQQIAVELKAWNGIAPDPIGRRIATVELALDMPRGIPKLFLLARRPTGFPESFAHDEHRFDSLSEGWYEPLPLPSNGSELLLNGFEWVSTQQTPHCILRRQGMPVIAFAVSEDTAGLVSRRRLLAGVECALLFHESAANVVRERVAQLGGDGRWIEDPDLPGGWKLVDKLRIGAPNADDMPGLEALEVDAAVELVTRGGLRVGRRAEWLTEAPPRIFVSGIAPEVAVDDRDVRVGADGSVAWSRDRATAGQHLVAAGRSYKRISLVEPQLSRALVDLVEPALPPATVPVGLARGQWELLGARPIEMLRVRLARQGIVNVPFEPVFAVTGGCALFLVARDVEAQASGADSDRRWANVIKEATQRNVDVATINPAVAESAMLTWRQFQDTARRILGSPGPTGSAGRS